MGNENGVYSVKSGYMWVKQENLQRKHGTVGEANHSKNFQGSRVWKELWGLNMKHKLKHFIWKCLRGVLPVNEVVMRRTGNGNSMCHRCGEAVETLEHMLFQCDKAALIWKAAPLQWDGLERFRGSFWHWWEELMQVTKREEGREHIILTANLLWQIWKARNESQFNKEERDPFLPVHKAVGEWREYQEATRNLEESEGERAMEETVGAKWMPPAKGSIKINTDAAFNKIKKQAGWGLAARNDEGRLIATWAIPRMCSRNAKMEEAMVIRKALEIALLEGWERVQVESDCKVVVDKLREQDWNDKWIGSLLEDIATMSSKFEECCFSFVPRNCNYVSHALAQAATNFRKETYWRYSIPVWLMKAAREDFEGSCSDTCT